MLDSARAKFKPIGFHHVHFYLEDVGYWCQWFETCLDFRAIATEIDSLVKDAQTSILQHGSIQIRLSAPLRASSPVAQFLSVHPPGIAEVGFTVNTDLLEDIVIPAWGDLTHRLIGKSHNQLPTKSITSSLFSHIDHIVLNVPVGEMHAAMQWYTERMGLRASDRFSIRTERSALKSIVMENEDRSIQMPINEPSTSNSQIQEFLDYNCGAGIQHLALHTYDIAIAVDRLEQSGVRFLKTEPKILIDTQPTHPNKALLQIFTQPIFDRPTFFFEIIQRRNDAQGFGEGNFQALFEAIEREQISRSTSLA
ncbi:VOC family protein [Pseudanabaena sp. PCC 6802]|uniref:VOC family protein n=1 Tax=Pseudanabaena sp. PCC 6802 TaxID=118173 RepID=UPI0003462DD7|nr:VOC family protein [Pseudanabaena sp. PCC 6802]